MTDTKLETHGERDSWADKGARHTTHNTHTYTDTHSRKW